MPWPTINVYVDWNLDYDFADAGEDISAYVKSVAIERGRDTNLGDVQVGTAEIRVINTDKRFSPEYASGDYYGNLKPMRPIYITATFGVTTYPLFWGYVLKFVPNTDRMKKDCYIYAVDVLHRFQQSKITTDLLTTQTEAELIDTIRAAVQATGETIATSLDTGEDTYDYAWFTGQNALEAVQNICKASNGLCYADESGTLIFESRSHRSAHTSVYTCDNDHYRMTYAYGERDIINRVTTTCSEKSVAAPSELWRDWQVFYVPAGETVTRKAVFAGPASTITTPAATTDYTGNSDSGGGGTNLTANISIVVTEYAESASLAVENTGAVGLYVTLLKLRGELLTFGDDGEYTAEDATSKTSYGPREDSFDSDLLNDIGDAENRSRYILARHKAPVSEITLTLRPDDDAKLIAMLTWGISDRITVAEDQTAVDGDFYIEKIRHQIEPGFMETQWTLSAIGVQAFILDTSVLDGAEVLSY
jgi:hypothetical protein